MNSEKTPAAQAEDTASGGLKIEAGKYYRTRDGRKVGPMLRVMGPHYIWSTPDVEGWTAEGRFFGPTEFHVLDLVAEWVNEPEKPVEPTFAVGDKVLIEGEIKTLCNFGSSPALGVQFGPTFLVVFPDSARKAPK